ncbi:uncharacterized protein ASPGLDRAFT_47128 [Aspergillus glaucus CBS 516.65]|uniref:Uncharacterized protein n=1 Tax=Aspergillus glaucus CBS 516.65 TaxID=1160497 RepID=A0A1L9VK56_ASPGL|nr:hypothetical protein ASPGLDRAFT_47128 [Aspergillus glaucus CBS 516.65]OJJ84282.1 hypothetical protein ASPGLDRAFT_47128 [Aspergillus glaucus CBS 516.65]
MRSVYPLLFSFLFSFFSLKIFPLVLSSGARPLLSPPNRGVWLVALDLVTVFLGSEGLIFRGSSSGVVLDWTSGVWLLLYRIEQYDIHS